jgi:hypothetical protein
VPLSAGSGGSGEAELSSLAEGLGSSDGPTGPVEALATEADRELKELQSSLAGTELVGALSGCCKTLDQAKAVLTFAGACTYAGRRRHTAELRVWACVRAV